MATINEVDKALRVTPEEGARGAVVATETSSCSAICSHRPWSAINSMSRHNMKDHEAARPLGEAGGNQNGKLLARIQDLPQSAERLTENATLQSA